MLYCRRCDWSGLIERGQTEKCPHCDARVTRNASERFDVRLRIRNWDKPANPKKIINNMGFKNVALEDVERKQRTGFYRTNTTKY